VYWRQSKLLPLPSPEASISNYPTTTWTDSLGHCPETQYVVSEAPRATVWHQVLPVHARSRPFSNLPLVISKFGQFRSLYGTPVHPRAPGVAAADCVSTSIQHLWHTPLQNSSLTSADEFRSCDIIFAWFQPHAARVTCSLYDANGFIRIPTSRVSVFKLGRVFAVFPRVTL